VHGTGGHCAPLLNVEHRREQAEDGVVGVSREGVFAAQQLRAVSLAIGANGPEALQVPVNSVSDRVAACEEPVVITMSEQYDVTLHEASVRPSGGSQQARPLDNDVEGRSAPTFELKAPLTAQLWAAEDISVHPGLGQYLSEDIHRRHSAASVSEMSDRPTN